jgi:D-sedoheptulose 7-phosphate isomerase
LNDYISAEIAKTRDLMGAMLADAELLAEVEAVSRACVEALRRGNKVMFAGNGGSAADAQHLAAELVGKLVFDRPGLASVALNTDTSILTAIGNDYGYEHVFSRQVAAVGQKGDVLVGISTSGRSKNVIQALEEARRRGIVTVGLTGASGGEMRALCDHCIRIPAGETQKIQEGHIVVGHIFCALAEREMFGRDR